jgi:hypothetical protein
MIFLGLLCFCESTIATGNLFVNDCWDVILNVGSFQCCHQIGESSPTVCNDLSISTSFSRISPSEALVTLSAHNEASQSFDFGFSLFSDFSFPNGQSPIVTRLPAMRGARFTTSDSASLTVVCQAPAAPSRFCAEDKLFEDGLTELRGVWTGFDITNDIDISLYLTVES